MDNLAKEMDRVMARLERAGMANCAPKLNPEKSASDWLSNKEAPWAMVDEKPQGETVPYDQLLADWKAGKVR
jgi:glycerol transport system substrate-binding protein